MKIQKTNLAALYNTVKIVVPENLKAEIEPPKDVFVYSKNSVKLNERIIAITQEMLVLRKAEKIIKTAVNELF